MTPDIARTEGNMAERSVVAPSLEWLGRLAVEASSEVPAEATAIGVPVGTDGDVPPLVGVTRATLIRAGFTGKRGTTVAVPSRAEALTIAVGTGDSGLDATAVRTAAAGFGRATREQRAVAIVLDGLAGDSGSGTDGTALDPAAVAAAVVEGIVLSRYDYDALRRRRPATTLERLVLVAPGSDDATIAALQSGIARGRSFARATTVARDLANCPHNFLSASDLAEFAATLAGGPLGVEVFDEEALIELGCGGLLGVNAGSAEPPRMIKLTYAPADAAAGGAKLALVGKGIMYDSGGIALKPGDTSHSQMKNDMSGAAAVLASMMILGELGCTTTVTGFMMCTDNMPSGTATALGDVITMRDGTTVEVLNTDAEGRLVMADALCLATEVPVDAVVDIATLTGACLRALGTKIAGVMGNDAAVVEQLRAAADSTGESVWELPLDERYRSELDTPIADLKNLGGPNAGAITAGLFLAEFVKSRPWAHLDIAGTAQADGDNGWETAGCTGFGARLLAQFALDFTSPEGS